MRVSMLFHALQWPFLYGVVIPFMFGVFQILIGGATDPLNLVRLSAAGVLVGIVHGAFEITGRMRQTDRSRSAPLSDREIRTSRRNDSGRSDGENAAEPVRVATPRRGKTIERVSGARRSGSFIQRVGWRPKR